MIAPAAPSATISFSISMRTRSADKLRKSRAGADAGEIASAIGLARAEGGVNAEKPENAQIILGDAPVRIADEAHAPCDDVVKAADVIVHDAMRRRPTCR